MDDCKVLTVLLPIPRWPAVHPPAARAALKTQDRPGSLLATGPGAHSVALRPKAHWPDSCLPLSAHLATPPSFLFLKHQPAKPFPASVPVWSSEMPSVPGTSRHLK